MSVKLLQSKWFYENNRFTACLQQYCFMLQ